MLWTVLCENGCWWFLIFLEDNGGKGGRVNWIFLLESEEADMWWQMMGHYTRFLE